MRIDANIATQLADMQRPQQSQRDSELQAAEVRRADLEQSETPAVSPASSEELKSAVEQLQAVIEAASGRRLDFALNDRFKELIVTVSDRVSGEVLKEIPSKEFMQLRERLNDLIGLFVNEKA